MMKVRQQATTAADQRSPNGKVRRNEPNPLLASDAVARASPHNSERSPRGTPNPVSVGICDCGTSVLKCLLSTALITRCRIPFRSSRDQPSELSGGFLGTMDHLQTHRGPPCPPDRAPVRNGAVCLEQLRSHLYRSRRTETSRPTRTCHAAGISLASGRVFRKCVIPRWNSLSSFSSFLFRSQSFTLVRPRSL